MLENGEKILSDEMKELVSGIGKQKRRPLGKFNVTQWAVEVTRGCNLRCGFCATRLFTPGKYNYMTIETWTSFMKIVAEVSPYNRVDMAQAGEPTLNPLLPDFLRIGRELSPHTFFEVITNGVTILDGSVKIDDLFEAGANLIYIDMYAPKERYIEKIKESGYDYYVRSEKKPEDPAAWTYHNDNTIKVVVLQESPGKWSENKKRTINFSTFFNNLDWKAAKPYGIEPVEEAPQRRCSQPFRTVPVNWDGTFSFCCFDFMRYTVSKFSNVSEGVSGFLKYWFGEYMQITRKQLHWKNRREHKFCSKCVHITSRADIPVWPDGATDYYIADNFSWHKNRVKINKVKVEKKDKRNKYKLIGRD